ncbi:MAG: hypothetical protein IKT46_02300 [Clostridia bacterium]|nr:hypothetical protein [Clostridia bacterium]
MQMPFAPIKRYLATDPDSASDESYDMYPVDGDTAVCDRDKPLVKLDTDKVKIIKSIIKTT